METIAAGVHQLSLGAHAFLVDGDQGVTLVDAGLPGRIERISDGLASIGRGFDDLAAIVVTHAHSDHLGSAAAVQRAASARLVIGAGDVAVARGQRPATPPPQLDRGPLAALFRLFPTATPVTVDHQVGEDASDGLPADFTAIDTPGHTPGHVSYRLDRAGGIMFVGDAAMASRRGRVTRGLPNRATPTIDASIRHLATYDFTAALFGHSRPLTSGAASAFRRFAATLG